MLGHSYTSKMKKFKENQDGDGEFKERKKHPKGIDEDAWERAEFNRIKQRLTGTLTKQERDYIDIEDWRD